jgi:hypothetical protein
LDDEARLSSPSAPVLNITGKPEKRLSANPALSLLPVGKIFVSGTFQPQIISKISVSNYAVEQKTKGKWNANHVGLAVRDRCLEPTRTPRLRLGISSPQRGLLR